MYNNEVTEILIKANYPGLADTKMWIEHDYDLVKPEELGGDGVKSFKESGHATQLIGDRKFLTPANNRVNIHKKPTRNYDPIPDSVWELWMDLLNTSNRYSDKELKEMNRIDELTPIEYREYHREQLEKASKPPYYEFECNLKDKVLQFRIDNVDRVDLLGQLTMGLSEVDIHDIKRENSEPYNAQELKEIMGTLDFVTRKHKAPYDAKIKALYELQDNFTKENVDVIVNG